MSDGVFDAEVAATYDVDHGGTDPALVAATVDVLTDLAQGGAALEFAIGTGRIALPLAAKGVPVSGIELSSAMVAEMRKKPGGAEIPVVISDICEAQCRRHVFAGHSGVQHHRQSDQPRRPICLFSKRG